MNLVLREETMKGCTRLTASVFALFACTSVFLGACVESRPLRPANCSPLLFLGAFFTPDSAGVYPTFIYSFDAVTLNVVDSVRIPYYPRDLAVTADGTKLYVLMEDLAKFDSTLLQCLSAQDGAILWSRPCSPYLRRMSLVDDGQLLMAGGDCLDARSGNVVRSFGDSLFFMDGIRSGTAAVFVNSLAGQNQDSAATVIDVVSGRMLGRLRARVGRNVPLNIYDAAIHPSQKLLMLLGATPNHAWFLIGNYESDSILMEFPLLYPYGDISISMDGSKVAVTDPGVFFITRWSTVDIFEFADFEHIVHLTRDQFPRLDAGQLAFSPHDDGLMIIAPPAHASGPGPTFVYDLRVQSMTAELCYPACYHGVFYGALASGCCFR